MVPMQKEKRLAYYQEHLKQIQEYEAIFAVSDSYAIELMHFLAVQGIRVPEDMMVIGFDDMPICRTNTPTLTSVRQDVKRRAQIAIHNLKELKEKRESETEMVIPVQLIERESTRGYIDRRYN